MNEIGVLRSSKECEGVSKNMNYRNNVRLRNSCFCKREDGVLFVDCLN